MHDVIVVGAGPGGAAAAYYLARAGLDVLLLDKASFPRDKTCGDGLTPRAVKALHDMGALKEVAARAHHCSAITLRHSEAIQCRLSLAGLAGLPDQVLVLPRLILDDILRRHAVRAGAHFVPGARVLSITRDHHGAVAVQVEGQEPARCALAIVATGANTSLLQAAGLSRNGRPINLGARCYFDGVEGLGDTVVLFFDEVNLPGYGWVFPTSPTSANIGCGAFSSNGTSQTAQLRRLIERHPYLRRILKNAEQRGPIRGYPLRTDFSPAHSGGDCILAVGEAAGLVNPITGEGIDYALESGQLAARAILEAWAGAATPAIHRRYRAALARRFRYQLALNRLAQKVYFRERALDSLLRRASESDYLRRAIVDTCFGSANPMAIFSPRTLWEVFGP